MKRLVWIAVALFTAASLVGCVKQYTAEEQNALAAKIDEAVLAVPGITEGGATVTRANELASLSINVRVISSAQTKEELLTVLEDVAHAVLESTMEYDNSSLPIQHASLSIQVENGTDIVRGTDLDPRVHSLKSLKEYLGQ